MLLFSNRCNSLIAKPVYGATREEMTMGIFDKIKHAIWGSPAAAQEEPAATSAETAPVVVETAAATTSPAAEVAAETVVAETTAPAPAAAAPAGPVDVAAMLDAAAEANGQKLDWRKSIVDLMKVLGMEASLAERKELAGELHYTGDMHDSAAMNIWLHKALMTKLVENGGNVPADLMD
jgi:Domain of unknown function (DUF3597)